MLKWSGSVRDSSGPSRRLYDGYCRVDDEEGLHTTSRKCGGTSPLPLARETRFEKNAFTRASREESALSHSAPTGAVRTLRKNGCQSGRHDEPALLAQGV